MTANTILFDVKAKQKQKNNRSVVGVLRFGFGVNNYPLTKFKSLP